MKKYQSKYYTSSLMCTVCETIIPVPRTYAEKRENNHIKHMWCYKCKSETPHVENSEATRRII